MLEIETMTDEQFNIRCGRKCKKCETFNEPLEDHHILPKHMGGTDIDGRITLCKKHHLELQDYIEIELRQLWLDNQPHEVLSARAKVITRRWIDGAI
jgi:hypothetical protein